MKRVLITGGGGFVGRHCLPLLADGGWDVHALTSRGPKPLMRGVRWHRADLLSGSAAERVLETVRPTHLLHLAWLTTPGIYWTSPKNSTWLQASRRLLERFVECGGERVVMAGTCAEYDWSAGRCREETTLLKPASLYGECKRDLHLWLQETAHRTGLSAAWARLFWTYGPHEPPVRLVPTVIRNLLAGRPAECTAGSQQRDFLFVKDVAAAMVRLLAGPVVGPVNVASGEAVPVAEIVGRIGRLLDAMSLVRLGAHRLSNTEPPLVVADVQRLREEVGFRPRWNLTEGLLQTIDWWKLREETRTHVG